MYRFKVTYIDIYTLKKSSVIREYREEFYPSEKEIFISAMKDAYKFSTDSKMFNSIELLACF